jgi:hypothetical protein
MSKNDFHVIFLLEFLPCKNSSKKIITPPSLAGRYGMNNFLKGLIIGAAEMLALALLILAFRFFYNRDRKIYEYMEAQNEIQTLQEDINNRSPNEFLEDPGIRGAADNADAEFRRKRDEAVQRIRGGHAD